MTGSSIKIKTILFIYWVFLCYIIAALIWWYIALTRQNELIAFYKSELKKSEQIYSSSSIELIEAEREKKVSQYLGEGSIFLLLIMAGAIFLFRAVKKQLKLSQEQQNFIVAVTHELKTPLSIAKLNLETLKKRKLETHQQEKLINNSLLEANRMNALCSNLLLSSQMEAGGYQICTESINLGALAVNTVKEFKERYPERELIAYVEEGIYSSADPFLIQIALNNLIDNAIKYTPKEEPIAIRVFKKEGFNHLQVEDKGTGIPDAEKKRVFEKYHRIGNMATKLSKGTGLGLYLVKRIVTASQGRIHVEDNESKGSRFIISLTPSASA